MLIDDKDDSADEWWQEYGATMEQQQQEQKNKSYLNCELVALHHVLIAANCVEVAL